MLVFRCSLLSMVMDRQNNWISLEREQFNTFQADGFHVSSLYYSKWNKNDSKLAPVSFQDNLS